VSDWRYCVILIILNDTTGLILLNIKQIFPVTMCCAVLYCTVLYCTVLTAPLLDPASETRNKLHVTAHTDLLYFCNLMHY